MALKKRLLQVTFTFPNGSTAVWDQNLMLRIKVKKNTLRYQSQAVIDVGGLSQDDRRALMTQFSAYAKRLRDNGDTGDNENFIGIEIMAGYDTTKLSRVFIGQVTLCDIVSPPPNIVIRVTAYTQQIDKSKWVDTAPNRVTFKAYCEWAATQMGLRLNCNTTIDDTIVENPGRTTYTVDSLLWDIQRYDRSNIAAFIDDDTLNVLNVGDVIKSSTVQMIEQFVGTPLWTEWGVNFSTMYDPIVRLATAVQLNSKLNPAVNNIALIIYSMEYNLESRGNNFTINYEVAPSSSPTINTLGANIGQTAS